MPDFSTVVLSAVVSFFTALITPTVSSWLTGRREKDYHFWQREVERIVALEERAGMTAQLVSAQLPGGEISPELRNLLDELRLDAGRFKRYSALSIAVQDFHHWSSCWVADKMRHYDWQEARTESDAAFKRLLAASAGVLKR